MAPQALFGVSPTSLPKLFFVGSRESTDAKRGASPAVLASMINRANNPAYGSVDSWLTPNQYAVLKKEQFNPNDAKTKQAMQYYSTPQGQKELQEAGANLKGVTDFRSTKYLNDTGNLYKYADNLIPAIVGGVKKFLTPNEIKQSGAKPDFTENTYFNETKRPPTKEWWKQSSSDQNPPSAQSFLNETLDKIKALQAGKSGSPSNTKDTIDWSQAFIDAASKTKAFGKNQSITAQNFKPTSNTNIASAALPQFSNSFASSPGGSFSNNISSSFGNSFTRSFG
jgi:hypothetical protein